MLNLLDAVEVEGLVVFRDDEDTRKFYVLPDQPVVPLDDRGDPDFLFVRYIKDLETTVEGEDDGAGYVQFRTALVLDPAKRARVLDQLRQRLVTEQATGYTPFGKPIATTEPLLANPVWTSGSVDLTTFEVSDTGLVRKATESAAVDLTGDLGAMLAVQLDDDGAEVFWTAFEGRGAQHVPISVQFDLGFKARVNARMEIHARHQVVHSEIVRCSRPYRLLRHPFARYVPVPGITSFVGGAQLAALRTQWAEPLALCLPMAQVSEVIRSAISSNTIDVRIETDQASAGEAGQKVQEALLGIATSVLSDRVIPMLFGGGTTPGASDEQGQTATTPLIQVGEQGPADDVRFDLVLDQSSTVEKTIHPNGPVQVLLGSDEQLARCFRTLRLSDRALAATQIVASTAGTSFADDGVAAVHVFFSYEHTDEADPGRPVVKRVFDGLLRAPSDVVRWRFDLARTADRRHIRQYLYRTEVLYTDGNKTSSPWRTSDARSLVLTPAAIGAVRVEAVLTAGAEVLDSAAVDLRCTPSSGSPFETTLQLTPAANRQTWFQPTGEVPPDGVAVRPPTYAYRVRYRVRGSELATDWRESAEPLLEVGSPFSRTLTFVVRPQGSFEGVSSVSGDLRYADPAHAYEVVEPFTLTSLTDSHPFSVGAFDGGPATVAWTARLTRTDGSGVNLTPGSAPAGTVWVGTDVDFLSVTVVPDLLDFAADVKLAVVALTFVDGAGPARTQTFTFTAASHDQQVWRVARSDRARSRYSAHIRYIAQDPARSNEVQLDQIDDQVLVLEHS